MEKDISPLERNFSKAKTYFDEFEDEGKHWLEKMESLKFEHEDIVEKNTSWEPIGKINKL